MHSCWTDPHQFRPGCPPGELSLSWTEVLSNYWKRIRCFDACHICLARFSYAGNSKANSCSPPHSYWRSMPNFRRRRWRGMLDKNLLMEYHVHSKIFFFLWRMATKLLRLKADERKRGQPNRSGEHTWIVQHPSLVYVQEGIQSSLRYASILNMEGWRSEKKNWTSSNRSPCFALCCETGNLVVKKMISPS